MSHPPAGFPKPATPNDDSFDVSQINSRKLSLLAFMVSYAYWGEDS